MDKSGGKDFQNKFGVHFLCYDLCDHYASLHRFQVPLVRFSRCKLVYRRRQKPLFHDGVPPARLASFFVFVVDVVGEALVGC